MPADPDRRRSRPASGGHKARPRWLASGALVRGARSCSVVVVSESDSAVMPFDELPVLPGSGLRQAWDVWGPGDNLGTLNRLTGPVVAAAAAAVRTGERSA